MALKKLILRDSFFHIMGRSPDHEPFQNSLDDLWKNFLVHLNFLSISLKFRVRAFVLMGNHFHLLISCPGDKVESAVEILKSSVNQTAGQVLFNRFQVIKINSPVYYQYAYKYIYRNPVKAGLCSTVESYSYSSLKNVLGDSGGDLILFDNMNLIQNPIGILTWLNEPWPYPPEIEELNQLFN